MKKLAILIIIALCASFNLFAQSPNSFNYQALIRNSDGEVLTNENIEVEVSIVHGTATGQVIYTETYSLKTDQNGLINFKIGTGNTSDNFDDINWQEGSFFLRITVNGTEMGTTQLLSVPYAKFADKAGNAFSGDYYDLMNLPDFSGWDKNNLDDFSGDYNDLINTPDPVEPIDTSRFISIQNPQVGDLAYYDGTKWQTLDIGNENQVLMIESGTPVWKSLVVEESINRIGELYLGGIIFYVSPDGQHGLVASLDNLDDGSGTSWSDITNITSNAISYYDGYENTELILSQGAGSSAASLCKTLGPDWYLPSAWELHLMYNAAYEINKVLDNDGDPGTNGIFITNDGAEGRYWSSTEYSNNRAWSFMFNYGYTANSSKTTLCRVRAIKAF